MNRRVDITAALHRLAPGAQFAIVGGAVVWHSPDIPQPTDAEIAVKLAELAVEAQLDVFRQAVQRHIDATARSRGYDDGRSLAGYVSSSIPAWRAEAEAFTAWRDQVWLYLFDRLAQVQAGGAAPDSPEALIAELPQIAWTIANEP